MDMIMMMLLTLEMMMMMMMIGHSSLGIPIGSEIENKQSEVQDCQHLLSYEEVYYLLTHRPCASNLSLRTKRDDDPTAASTNNIYALQSTINDHRTIIDDHRKMIHYLINNTVNITQLNEYYTEQHAKTAPIWKSWRDVTLLLLIVISFCAILWLLARQFHPLDMLTSILLRRYQNQQLPPRKRTKNDHVVTMSRHKHKQMPPPPPPPISNIEREYMRYERDSNSSLQN